MATLTPRTLEWTARAPMRIAAQAVSTASPQAVFDVLADHERWPEWFPSLRRVTVTGAATGVGARRRVALTGLTVDEEFIAWDPGQRWSFTGTAARPGLLTALVEDCVLTPADGGGTTITYTMYLDTHRRVRPVLRALSSRVQANNEQALRNLARRAQMGPAAANTGPVDVWGRVQALRLQLAGIVEDLSEIELDTPSWCAEWRVRDTIGHLVHLAEATQLSMASSLVRGGVVPERALTVAARRIGAAPAAELAARLRAAAGGRFHPPATPAAVALGEVIVHGADALRPLSRSLTTLPSDARSNLDIYRRVGRLAFHGRIPSGVRLVADDAAWSSGNGPEVHGSATDLLLLLANRRQVVGVLTGPGVALLSA